MQLTGLQGREKAGICERVSAAFSLCTLFMPKMKEREREEEEKLRKKKGRFYNK
jgi:hypothetical protein